jgi:3',5'-cyclic AMP phosphodiesterase CpdA
LRTVAHISDLHFGRLDQATVSGLTTSIVAAKPDVVVVSGDVTQRARDREFAEARRFLNTLPTPQIIVPGNHDVPLYNLISRSLTPLKKFRQHITNDLEPYYGDGEIAIVGINTARSLTIKDGRINFEQVASSCARLETSEENVVRILVTHHPFDVEMNGSASGLVGRAQMAMAGFARCRVDMILSGHLHTSRTGDTRERYKNEGHSALLVQAGTATSSRSRGESNAWNLIRVEREQISVECMSWDVDSNSFVISKTEHFVFGKDGWSRSSATPPAPKHEQ